VEEGDELLSVVRCGEAYISLSSHWAPYQTKSFDTSKSTLSSYSK